MQILVLGAGNIGTTIACLLYNSGHYQVVLAGRVPPKIIDKKITFVQCDIYNNAQFSKILKSSAFDAIISALPYHANIVIAKKARKHHLHYFDLTEDVATTAAIIEIARGAKTAFIPQCGMAPGFINIIAANLMENYDHLDSVLLRVGALPQHPDNALKYALTWSTEGLINQYGNPCEAIVDGKFVSVAPLCDLETIEINGTTYEAFNTSGGLGALWKSCAGKVTTMNYKTLRYPGHCEKMKFLMNDLHLNQHRDVLKNILEAALPCTDKDVVVVFVSITGQKNKRMVEAHYANQLYPAVIHDQSFTAIQMATATGVCALVDLVLTKQYVLSGFISQDRFAFQDVIENQFGRYYAEHKTNI